MDTTDGDTLDQLIANATASSIAYLGREMFDKCDRAEIFIPEADLPDHTHRDMWFLRNAKAPGNGCGTCEEEYEWDAGWEQGVKQPDYCGDHEWDGTIRLYAEDEDYDQFSHLIRPGWTVAQHKLFCELRQESCMPPSQALEAVESLRLFD